MTYRNIDLMKQYIKFNCYGSIMLNKKVMHYQQPLKQNCERPVLLIYSYNYMYELEGSSA